MKESKDMTFKEFLKEVTRQASDFAHDEAEKRYWDGKDSDFDGLFEDFIEAINDAVIDGIDDGMERWNSERPKTEQEMADERADEWYTAHKEGCV